MISICNTHYLDTVEARKFLGMHPRNWQMYRHRIPFIKHDDEDYWKLTDLEEVKEKMDPDKYILESALVIELETYWLKFKEIVERLNLPRIKHPLHTRRLYRTSDIALIQQELDQFPRRNRAKR